jgi:type IV pilus assembly protein PilW
MLVTGRPRRTQRGMSIVELLVGVAVGLIVVAAATLTVATQLADNRRLLIETQVQQDLRATADIITRDVRRAGYWGEAWRGTSIASAAAPVANPYAAMEPADDDAEHDEVSYVYADPKQPEDNVVSGAETLGFRLNNGVIESQLGDGNWQALTDAATLAVTQFAVTTDVQQVVLPCFRACVTGGVGPCPPVQDMRLVTVAIQGRATTDASVRRTIRSQVHLRNDPVRGECRD